MTDLNTPKKFARMQIVTTSTRTSDRLKRKTRRLYEDSDDEFQKTVRKPSKKCRVKDSVEYLNDCSLSNSESIDQGKLFTTYSLEDSSFDFLLSDSDCIRGEIFGLKFDNSTNESTSSTILSYSTTISQIDQPCSEKDLPLLELPNSSTVLPLSEEYVNEHLMTICSIYEILKHFKFEIRLSPFSIVDFIKAIQLNEINLLCSEIHLALLKSLFRNDEANGSVIGSNEVKDSIIIHLYSCDSITWPQVLKLYLRARANGKIVCNKASEEILKLINNTPYALDVDFDVKLKVLQYLCDLFLETDVARHRIKSMQNNTITHDDHCRRCTKLGDLLCCDNCSSTWHLNCLDPILKCPPENGWICLICKLFGINQIEQSSARTKKLGFDRNGRKYWFLCDLLIVEQDEGPVRYYSTDAQLEDLISLLDPLVYEKNLVVKLLELKNKFKENSKAFLSSQASYVNLFNINIYALNKYQHQQERDKKKQLTSRFFFVDFKWQGNQCPNVKLLQTLRKALIQLENSFPSGLMHNNWLQHRKNWLSSVQLSNNAKQFAELLSILERSVKQVIFIPVWNESLGYIIGEYMTSLDKEERKQNDKRDKREMVDDLEMLMRKNSVKYSLLNPGLVHARRNTLFKQQGEEYRVTGKNGWIWQSSTRVHRKSQSKIEIIKQNQSNEERKLEYREVIDVENDLKLNLENRNFYSKQLSKKSSSKFNVDNLLARREKLQKALRLEGVTGRLACYSSDCLMNVLCEKKSTLKCYNSECLSYKLNKVKTSDITYLFKVNQQNKIQRKLNSKRLLPKGELPPTSKFLTKNKKQSIFVLPDHDLRKLSRSGGLREVPGFIYTAKVNPHIWPLDSTPRPSFRTCWLYKNSIINSNDHLSTVALSLRVFWHCIRWTELKNKSNNQMTMTPTQIITTQILKKRDLSPFGIRSEYFIRKVVVPIDNKKEENQLNILPSAKRAGLRERKKKLDELDRPKLKTTEEKWVSETELSLAQMRKFGEDIEKQNILIQKKEREHGEKETMKIISSKKKEESKMMKKNAPVSTKKSLSPVANQFKKGFAMIRTSAGQLYKIPSIALGDKIPGQQIMIKLSGSESLTQATVLSKFTETSTKSKEIKQTVKPAMLCSNCPNKTNKLNQKFEGSKVQVSTQLTNTDSLTTITQVNLPEHTINNDASIRIPVKLSDGYEMKDYQIQLPISLLMTNKPIHLRVQVPTPNYRPASYSSVNNMTPHYLTENLQVKMQTSEQQIINYPAQQQMVQGDQNFPVETDVQAPTYNQLTNVSPGPLIDQQPALDTIFNQPIFHHKSEQIIHTTLPDQVSSYHYPQQSIGILAPGPIDYNSSLNHLTNQSSVIQSPITNQPMIISQPTFPQFMIQSTTFDGPISSPQMLNQPVQSNVKYVFQNPIVQTQFTDLDLIANNKSQ